MSEQILKIFLFFSFVSNVRNKTILKRSQMKMDGLDSKSVKILNNLLLLDKRKVKNDGLEEKDSGEDSEDWVAQEGGARTCQEQ